VVPEGLRNSILKLHHDSLGNVHCGRNMMNRVIRDKYWWSTRSADIALYIKSCDSCAERKKHGQVTMPLQELPPVSEPFQKVGMDITELPPSSGYRYILTIVDHLSRFLTMIPLKNQTAESIARKINRHFISIFGVPRSCLTDCGKNFLSNLMSQLCELYDIDKMHTVAYSPQSNGRTERVHHSIKKYISYFINEQQDNWHDLLPIIVAAYNNLPHTTLNKTPYEVVFGRKMTTMFNIGTKDAEITNEKVVDLATKLKQVWNISKKLNHQAFLEQAKYYDRKSNSYTFKKDEKVWLQNPRVLPGKSKRLTKKYLGPFKVIEMTSPVLVKIQLPDTQSIVHGSRLKPHILRPETLAAAVCPQAAPAAHTASAPQSAAPAKVTGKRAAAAQQSRQQPPAPARTKQGRRAPAASGSATTASTNDRAQVTRAPKATARGQRQGSVPPTPQPREAARRPNLRNTDARHQVGFYKQ